MQFADYLLIEKCGGSRPWPEIVVEIGQRWRCEDYDGTTLEDVTVTPENLERVRAAVNDRENDFSEWIPVGFKPRWEYME